MDRIAETEQVVGIDVSGDRLEVPVFPAGDACTVAYTQRGLWQLISRLSAWDVGLVVLEATGGLHKQVAELLAEAGHAVAVVNPRQVRDFARALGLPAGPVPDPDPGTDRIDAYVIARFGEATRPRTRVDADRRPAGVGPSQPPKHRQPGRRRTDQPGQWRHAGQADHLGRPGGDPRRALYGGPGGVQKQPADPAVLRSADHTRQAAQGRPDHLYVKRGGPALGGEPGLLRRGCRDLGDITRPPCARGSPTAGRCRRAWAIGPFSTALITDLPPGPCHRTSTSSDRRSAR